MLTSVALVLNKLHFTTQILGSWSSTLQGNSPLQNSVLFSPHPKQQSNFLTQVLFFFSQKERPDYPDAGCFSKIIHLAIESLLVYSKISSLSAQWLQMPGSSNCTLIKDKQQYFSEEKSHHRKFLLPCWQPSIFQPVSNYVNFRMFYTLAILQNYRPYSGFQDSKSTHPIIGNK